MNKRHYEHTLPNIRGSLSNTYVEKVTKDFSDDATYRQKLELGGRAE